MKIKTYVTIALVIFLLIVANIFIIGFFVKNATNKLQNSNGIGSIPMSASTQQSQSQTPTQTTQAQTQTQQQQNVVSTPTPQPVQTPMPIISHGRRTAAS